MQCSPMDLDLLSDVRVTRGSYANVDPTVKRFSLIPFLRPREPLTAASLAVVATPPPSHVMAPGGVAHPVGLPAVVVTETNACVSDALIKITPPSDVSVVTVSTTDLVESIEPVTVIAPSKRVVVRPCPVRYLLTHFAQPDGVRLWVSGGRNPCVCYGSVDKFVSTPLEDTPALVQFLMVAWERGVRVSSSLVRYADVLITDAFFETYSLVNGEFVRSLPVFSPADLCAGSVFLTGFFATMLKEHRGGASVDYSYVFSRAARIHEVEKLPLMFQSFIGWSGSNNPPLLRPLNLSTSDAVASVLRSGQAHNDVYLHVRPDWISQISIFCCLNGMPVTVCGDGQTHRKTHVYFDAGVTRMVPLPNWKYPGHNAYTGGASGTYFVKESTPFSIDLVWCSGVCSCDRTPSYPRSFEMDTDWIRLHDGKIVGFSRLVRVESTSLFEVPGNPDGSAYLDDSGRWYEIHRLDASPHRSLCDWVAARWSPAVSCGPAIIIAPWTTKTDDEDTYEDEIWSNNFSSVILLGPACPLEVCAAVEDHVSEVVGGEITQFVGPYPVIPKYHDSIGLVTQTSYLRSERSRHSPVANQWPISFSGHLEVSFFSYGVMTTYGPCPQWNAPADGFVKYMFHCYMRTVIELLFTDRVDWMAVPAMFPGIGTANTPSASNFRNRASALLALFPDVFKRYCAHSRGDHFA